MRYVASRLGQTVFTIFLVSIALFLILRSVPGDPAVTLAGPDAPPEAVAAIRAEYGFDQPAVVQYLTWLGNIVQGDFGESIVYRESVVSLALEALHPSLELISFSMFLGLVIGIPLGVLAARRARSWFDVGLGYFTAGWMGMPTFWLGLLALMVFAVRLDWVPTSGWVSIFDDPVESVRAMILPALAMGIGLGLGLARFVRSAMLEQLTADHVRTARAKGASERAVVWRHAFPNALVPVVTILGIQLGVLLGGTVVIERVFTRPGIGSLLVGGISTRDYALVQGVVLLVVVWYALINLLVDLSYGLIDPRIRK